VSGRLVKAPPVAVPHSSPNERYKIQFITFLLF
jgi:hypothetical protein